VQRPQDRRFFGCYFFEKGRVEAIPLHLVQEWLGHANMTMTAIDADAAGAEENDMARGM